MNMTITTGPWVAVGGMVEHENDKVADICSCYPDNFQQGHLKRSEQEIAANAKLIAVAPVMLSVLQDILKEVSLAFEKTSVEEIDPHLQSIFDSARFITTYFE
jgi:hypothetical protein